MTKSGVQTGELADRAVDQRLLGRPGGCANHCALNLGNGGEVVLHVVFERCIGAIRFGRTGIRGYPDGFVGSGTCVSDACGLASRSLHAAQAI